MTNDELRFFTTKLEVIEERSEGKGIALRGHAAVFNTLSENLGGFREEIDPGAFDNVLDNDVRAVFNHDPNFVLGRTKSGTLRMTTDNTGLAYEIDLPNTQVARDLAESVRRGDIDGSSFKFTVMSDEWRETSEGDTIRRITSVGRLLDVGPVTFPAYPDASVAQRSLNEYKEKKESEIACQPSIRSLKLKLAKVSL